MPPPRMVQHIPSLFLLTYIIHIYIKQARACMYYMYKYITGVQYSAPLSLLVGGTWAPARSGKQNIYLYVFCISFLTYILIFIIYILKTSVFPPLEKKVKKDPALALPAARYVFIIYIYINIHIYK